MKRPQEIMLDDVNEAIQYQTLDRKLWVTMEISIELSQLGYQFLDKPLLIGGKAMEYYGLRKAGADIDFVISGRDHDALRRMYPSNLKVLFGDIGVCVFGFEIWDQICRFRYEFLSQNGIERNDYLVASVDKLILLKSDRYGKTQVSERPSDVGQIRIGSAIR